MEAGIESLKESQTEKNGNESFKKSSRNLRGEPHQETDMKERVLGIKDKVGIMGISKKMLNQRKREREREMHKTSKKSLTLGKD